MTAEVVYIAGSGHSGSTLLEVLLANQPGLIGLGEVHKLLLDVDQLCACESSVRDCEFWSRILSSVAGDVGAPNIRALPPIFPLTLVRGTRRMPGPSPLDAVLAIGAGRWIPQMARMSRSVSQGHVAAQNSWQLFDRIAEITDSSLLIDKSCNAVRLGLLSGARPKSLKVIHLVRDGRAVSASGRRRLDQTLEVAAARWSRENRNVRMVLRHIPQTHQTVIRYEDLCADPLGTLNELADFLGFDASTADEFTTRDVHSIPGNRKMLRSDHRSIRLDERWRTELTPEEIARVNKKVRAELTKYRYLDELGATS